MAELTKITDNDVRKYLESAKLGLLFKDMDFDKLYTLKKAIDRSLKAKLDSRKAELAKLETELNK